MGNSNTPQEVANNIWKYIWEGNINKIRPLLDKYTALSDKFFPHPIMHENAHQSGKNPHKDDITDEMKQRFIKQNELFKYIWTHPKMIDLRNNLDYTDKNGYTAMQRLRIEYQYYCDDMKSFVKENICKDIEKVKCIEREYPNRGNYTFENMEYFGKMHTIEDVS
jgi:hypothetical protein